MGYRHCTREPFYFARNRLYRVPQENCECALFDVPQIDEAVLHPFGGHNYYSGRDLEKAMRRRIGFLGEVLSREENWEERYREYLTRREGQ
jgi:hypothetical protein